jgi:hypothetical protein
MPGSLGDFLGEVTAGASATTPPPANGVIFQDNFSSKASEWLPYQEAWTGRYANGAYRISAPPSANGDARVSSPRRASSVYPSAPSDIRIEVQARRLPASDQNMNYGIACRLHGDNAYVLSISDDYASIERYGAYKLLKEAKIPVNANSAIRRARRERLHPPAHTRARDLLATRLFRAGLREGADRRVVKSQRRPLGLGDRQCTPVRRI